MSNLANGLPEGVSADLLNTTSERSAKEEVFLRHVRSGVSGTQRNFDFSSIMSHAEQQAEEDVKNLVINGLPEGINPIDLRKWAISRLQSKNAIKYLIQQAQEAEEFIRQGRLELIKRLALRGGG